MPNDRTPDERAAELTRRVRRLTLHGQVRTAFLDAGLKPDFWSLVAGGLGERFETFADDRVVVLGPTGAPSDQSLDEFIAAHRDANPQVWGAPAVQRQRDAEIEAVRRTIGSVGI